ncbi:hypothetical protein GW17_00055338 [Ensete ventricosum]|nr:hypothetical protein GW17_00055338 [Ensete ventricosum]
MRFVVRETKAVGESESGGEGELDHHVVDTMGGGVGEDEVGDSGDKNAQEEDGQRDFDFRLRAYDMLLGNSGSVLCLWSLPR